MRVALVTNILPGYRVPVFRELASTPGWQLRVFLSARTESDRNWPFDAGDLDVEITRSFTFLRRITTRGSGAVSQVSSTHLPWSLLAALLRFRPDVVISAELGARTLLALIVCRILGVPLVVWTYHSRNGIMSMSRFGRVLRRLLLAHASAVVGMGSQARAILVALGVPSSRIFDAPNAHDHEGIHSALARTDVDSVRQTLLADFACRPRVALVAGRLVPSKGIVPLLQAWERLPEKVRDDWTLLFVGSGPLESLVEETMAAAPDGEIVHLPAVQPLELISYYAVSSLLIFPSLADPWGLVVNEAFACGVPVVCSSLAGCAADLVRPGENGWLIDPMDPDKLERVLLEALSHQKLGGLGEAARATAERFRPAVMAGGMRKAVQFAMRAARDRRES